MGKIRPAWKTKEWAEGRKKIKDPYLKKFWDRCHEKGNKENFKLGGGGLIEIIRNPPAEWNLEPGEGIIRFIRNPPAKWLDGLERPSSEHSLDF